MRTLLICIGILVVLMPIVIIIGNIMSKPLITHNEYLYIVFAFAVTVLLYDKKKSN